MIQVGGQAVLGRQIPTTTPWLTERHGYDPTLLFRARDSLFDQKCVFDPDTRIVLKTNALYFQMVRNGINNPIYAQLHVCIESD